MSYVVLISFKSTQVDFTSFFSFFCEIHRLVSFQAFIKQQSLVTISMISFKALLPILVILGTTFAESASDDEYEIDDSRNFDLSQSTFLRMSPAGTRKNKRYWSLRNVQEANQPNFDLFCFTVRRARKLETIETRMAPSQNTQINSQTDAITDPNPVGPRYVLENSELTFDEDRYVLTNVKRRGSSRAGFSFTCFTAERTAQLLDLESQWKSRSKSRKH